MDAQVLIKTPVHVRLRPHVPNNPFQRLARTQVHMSRLTGLLVVAMVASLALGPGIAVATEDPRFETTVSEQYVTPGQTESLSVTVLNDAEDADDEVEKATNVNVRLLEGATPFTVTSGSRNLGTLRDGVPTQTAFMIDVPQDVDSGTYTLPVRITYEYDGDERETSTRHIEVTVSDRARFDIIETKSDVNVKSDGQMSVTVENIGSEAATDATLQMESRTQSIAFEGSQSGIRSLGALEPGEHRTLHYSVTAREVAEPDQYPVTGTVKYDNSDGARQPSKPLASTVSVTREQSFTVNKTVADLRVDRDGTVTVSVKNTGPRSIQNGNVILETGGRSLHPTQTEVAVGDLDPGESASATYEIAVDEDTTPTDRQLTVHFDYEDLDGDRQRADPKTVRVGVTPEQPVYDVERVDTTVAAGDTREITIQVTNTDSVTVSSLNAKAYTDAPISIPDDSAFVSELEPGESTTVSFQVSAPGTALVKDYPISLDFQYDEPDGDTKLTDAYDVPVTVVEGTTFWQTLTASLESIDVPTTGLMGGAAGIGISGLGFASLVVYRRRNADE